MLRSISFIALVVLCASAVADNGVDVYEAVDHHNVDNDGVNIHYVTLGEGPVILFVHGFPNWWYDWRNQLGDLSDAFKCVAMDTRAYNKSGRPQGVENYSFAHLMSDVEAVIDDLAEESVTLVGHDWGGGISWRFAAHYPTRVNKLIIFNLTHPTAYMKVRESGTPEQLANMNYIKMIHDTPDMSAMFNAKSSAARLASSSLSEADRARYKAAYENNDFNSMLDYYRGLYPLFVSGEYGELPTITMPVLQFQGLKDTAVDKDGLRDTWNYIEKDYTLVTFPEVGHDPHHDATEAVNSTIRSWILSRP